MSNQLLGADVMAELPALRALAESLMVDTFRAWKPTGGFTTNAEGYRVRDYTPMGDVPGKVQSSSSGSDDTTHRTVRVGDVEQVVLEAGLHIPIIAPLPAAGLFGVGWEYECIAIGPLTDPALLGRRYLVVSSPAKSLATARRLDVAEVPT